MAPTGQVKPIRPGHVLTGREDGGGYEEVSVEEYERRKAAKIAPPELVQRRDQAWKQLIDSHLNPAVKDVVAAIESVGLSETQEAAIIGQVGDAVTHSERDTRSAFTDSNMRASAIADSFLVSAKRGMTDVFTPDEKQRINNALNRIADGLRRMDQV